MTFSTNRGILYQLFSKPRILDYHILSKWGDLYKKYKAGWSLLFQPPRLAPCRALYQFSDTKIQKRIDTTNKFQYIY
jgi:hypothetical protein